MCVVVVFNCFFFIVELATVLANIPRSIKFIFVCKKKMMCVCAAIGGVDYQKRCVTVLVFFY